MPSSKHVASALILCAASTVSADATDPFSSSLPSFTSTSPTARDLSSGEASVASLTGAATYSYPVDVPPGRRGMQPSLQLSYSSQGALYGSIAAGWSLGGIATIERDTTGGAGAPRYKVGDARLVPVSDDGLLVRGQSSPSTPYRLEFDAGFTRFGLGANGVWYSRTPDGTTQTYGQVDAGRWWLTSQEDRFGNVVTYTYSLASGSPDITRIEYGANTAAGLQHHAAVQLIWGPMVFCDGSAFVPIGAQIDRGVLRGPRKLTRIQTEVRDAPGGAWRTVRQIDLGYDTAAEACNGSAAPNRYLTSITERAFSKSGVSTQLPVSTFTYGPRGRTYSTPIHRTIFKGQDLCSVPADARLST